MANDAPSPRKDGRKRLPVLGASSENEARPRWHWSIIVGLGTLFGWLLLEMVAVPWIAGPLAESGRLPLVAAVHLAALALPAMGAGALGGRVGKRARAIDAVGGAVGLIVLVSVLAYFRVGAHDLWVVASALAAAAAGGGAALGFVLGRRRPAPEA